MPRSYVMRVLVAFDQLCNVIAGGLPDETISSRVGRLYRTSRLARAIRWLLNHIQRHHTQLAIEHDEQRAAQLLEIEKDACCAAEAPSNQESE